MKKSVTCFIIVVMMLCLASGCGTDYAKDEYVELKIDKSYKEETPEPAFPDEFAREYWFSSGVGGWRTYLNLKADGSFDGQHTDSDMGVSGDGYVATQYICNFSGKFEFVEKIDSNSYKVVLKELTMENAEGEEWIEDEVCYIAVNAYGISGGEEFILYTPDTPTAGLSDEFISWWPKGMGYAPEEQPDTLTQYAIYNISTGEGFFS